MVPRTARMSFGVEPSEGPDEEMYSTPLMLRWIARCTSDWMRSGISVRSRAAGTVILLSLRKQLALMAAANRNNYFLPRRNWAPRSIRFGYSVGLTARRPLRQTETSLTK